MSHGVLNDTPVLEGLAPDQRALIEQRFWSHVGECGEGCWEWVGQRQPDGYGRTSVGRRTLAAHRLSYELYVGTIPSRKFIDHLCRNRACVRPSHLEPVLTSVNVRRGSTPGVVAERNRAMAAARTHCAQGHPYDEENTGINWVDRERGMTQRYCRECNRQNSRKQRERRRLEQLGRTA